MNTRIILLSSLMLAGVYGATAQQRKCDMAINLLEPAPSAVINAYAAYDIKVNIINNGPDSLLAGDTLYYNKPSEPLINYDPYILTQPIPAGDNITITLETLNNINDDVSDQTMDYYLFIKSNLSNTGAFIDTAVTHNNYDVNTAVTFKAGQPTAINDMGHGEVALLFYPNPAFSKINFTLESGNKAQSAIISDILGRKVLETSFDHKTKQDSSLDVSALLPGMYIVQIQTDQGRATGKFIKK